MRRSRDVFGMHVSRRTSTWGMPLMLSLAVVAIMIVITLAMRLAGVDTLDPTVASGLRNNQGIVGTLVGFLVALGVQASVACFTFATALGTTRRDYVLGTGLYFLLQTVYVSALLAVLLALEKATNHWFIGAHSLDVYALGAGDWSDFLIAVPCGVLASLALGSLTGASWLRFGSRGPMIIVVATVALVFGAILLVIPRFEAFLAWFS
ncbi:MAG TPA: hypothetical protein VLR88_03450, partial [Propionibacteriaceae bacterium]|nr:hypothetical protein [Propionibacteriaceae bacterium]